jgi:WD40 repeat protein
VAGVWPEEPLVVTGHEGGQIARRAAPNWDPPPGSWPRPAPDQSERPSGGYLRGWNPLTGEESHAITAGRLPRSGVTAVVRHGQALALVGAQDGQVHVYDLANGLPQNVLATHGDGVTRVLTARIGDHDYAVTGGADGSVRVVDLDAPRSARSRRRSDPGPVRALAVGRSRVVSIGDDGSVVDRDLLTGDESRTHRLQKTVAGPRRLAIGWGPSGRAVVVSVERDRVRVLGHPEEGSRELPLPPWLTPGDVEAVAVQPVSPTRSQVAVSVAGRGSRPATVELFDVDDFQVTHLGSALDPATGATAVALSFAATSDRRYLTAVDAAGRAVVRQLGDSGWQTVVHAVETGIADPTAVATAVVRDQVVLALGTRERTVELWDVRSGERRTRRPLACAEPVGALAVHTDGSVLLSQGRDVLAVEPR